MNEFDTRFDTLLIGYDAEGKDDPTLVVGRKTPGEVIDTVNMFQGEEAIELYRKLINKNR